ncbi:MAG TPA: hypothetical protein VNR18_14800 [Hyphomicrobiales bacterium]|nr:hypothetical protein [Hyphomicrobiales bacterium]
MSPQRQHERSTTGAVDAFRYVFLLPLFALLLAAWASTAHPLHPSLAEEASDMHGPVATLSSAREQLLPQRRADEGWLSSPPNPTPLPAAAFALTLSLSALARPRAVAAPVPSLPLVLRPAAPRAPPRIPARA